MRSMSSLDLTDGQLFTSLPLHKIGTRAADNEQWKKKKKLESGTAGLGVRPIRTTRDHCTAALMLPWKARRFTRPIISDTDHN